MPVLWKHCRHYLLSVTSHSTISTTASCATHILSMSALPTLSLQVLESAGSTWIANGLDGDGDNDFDFDPSSLCDWTGPQLDEVFIALQLPEHQVWLRSLSCDPVKLVADIVHYICASDSRKQVFADLVHLCTKSDPESCDAPLLQLIQHIRTQWDSVYLMLQCFRVLQKVSFDVPSNVSTNS